MKLLDFSNDQLPNIDYGKFLIKNEVKNPNSISGPNQESPEEENVSVKEEEEDSDDSHSHDDEEDSSFDNSDNDHVAGILIPAFDAPVGQIIRDQTLLVKPFKYSHYSEYPQKFCQAISYQFQKPNKFLNSTWVFKTKPATVLSPENVKARLCIQGFLQTYGKDYFGTFTPTGKLPSLLALLVVFLFAPLEEEIYIKTLEGLKRTAPYLKLVKSLYGLKQAPKNWYETLTVWFEEIDYCPSVSDVCLFIHKDKNSFIFFY
ncbi:hypothetical protein VP01_6061g2 [Puccinia sorghi]|uniref:Reverse transcriptase Ty1/copia-type domain-containing protein n=1 Tax=Puccinia sorghi TaxID=27349 RepID=A0A0L6UJC5_9BASI|nr:hypothetical protein VP01_6061g2 [Puccinia sorghi]